MSSRDKLLSNPTMAVRKYITGKDFSKFSNGTKFYKFLTKDEIHKKKKLNNDSTHLNNNNNNGYSHVGLVSVPNSAKIYIDVDKGEFKTDRITVEDIIGFDNIGDEFWMKIFEHDVNAFKYVEHPTYDTCIKAISHDGMMLRFIVDQHKTEEICKTAVQQRGCALQFVPEKLQTDEICLLAVKQNAHAIEFIKNPSKQLLEKLRHISPYLQLSPSASCRTNTE